MNNDGLNYLRTLIPKNKFDFTPFPALMEVSEDKVRTILPELLSWVADMNWPVAAAMVEVLARFPESVVPLVKELLKPTETDEERKYFTIVGLIPALPTNTQEQLGESIKRILDAPTDGEVRGGVWEVANDYSKGRR